MKNKLLICLFLCVALFSCTNNSGLTLTLPDKSLILEKLNGNNYMLSESRNNYQADFANNNTAFIETFDNGGTLIQNNYTFEKEVFAVAGFYKKDNVDDEYLLIYPTANAINSYVADQKAYDSIMLILEVIDTEKDGSIVLNNFLKALATTDNSNLAQNLIDANTILSGASISPEKEAELRASLGGLNKAGQPKNFKDGQTYKKVS